MPICPWQLQRIFNFLYPNRSIVCLGTFGMIVCPPKIQRYCMKISWYGTPEAITTVHIAHKSTTGPLVWWWYCNKGSSVFHPITSFNCFSKPILYKVMGARSIMPQPILAGFVAKKKCNGDSSYIPSSNNKSKMHVIKHQRYNFNFRKHVFGKGLEAPDAPCNINNLNYK